MAKGDALFRLLADVTGATDADGQDESYTRATPTHLPPTPEEVGIAAALCYINEESDERIAGRLGIGRRTLVRWKHRPEFVAAMTAVRTLHEHELCRDPWARVRSRPGL